MIIKLISDLHLEFAGQRLSNVWRPNDTDKDTTLVIAGDFHVGRSGTDQLVELCGAFKNVVRVLGNHEFYYFDFNKTKQFWDDFENDGPANYFFLNNSTRYIDGVRFIGGTMWTDFQQGDALCMLRAEQVMNDYAEIRFGDGKISPQNILDEHRAFMTHLHTELDVPYDGDTVVVTHHSPGSPERRATIYRDSQFYYADIEGIVGCSNIKLWCHGHVHTSQDYMINETRVLCNPFGYHGYHVNPNFLHDTRYAA